jgi:ribosomal protein S12
MTTVQLLVTPFGNGITTTRTTNNKNPPKKKAARKCLLVALYSGWGTYSKLVEMTAHINKAYAWKWNHDVVLVQGAVI